MTNNKFLCGKPHARLARDVAKTGLRSYLLAAFFVGMAFVLRVTLDPLWGNRLPFGTFFLAQLAIAQLVPEGAFIVAMLSGFILADWYFVAPRHSLVIDGTVSQLNAVFFFFLNLVVLFFSSRARKALARERAMHDELLDALSNIKVLEGLLPICASCKKIRDGQGSWNQLELFIRNHSAADFTHSICPDCVKALYPELRMEPETMLETK